MSTAPRPTDLPLEDLVNLCGLDGSGGCEPQQQKGRPKAIKHTKMISRSDPKTWPLMKTPNADLRFSCRTVFLIIISDTPAKDRGQLYPNIFDTNGDIKGDRESVGRGACMRDKDTTELKDLIGHRFQ